MKGVILAGGSGSRLHPLTKVTNKHLLPVYNKPMVCYPLEKLIQCGIKDIMLVSGRGHAGHFLELLGSGSELGINLTYEVQERAGGIAEALSLCEKWAGRDPVLVILGDNIIEDSLADAVKVFKSGAHLFIKEVDNPERFGVARIDEMGQILEIVEKPNPAFSPYAVTGAYIYDPRVFQFIKLLEPSSRNELEITDINNRYLKMHELSYSLLNGYWSDAGTFESLYRANELVYKSCNR